jgi:hypothetical protein
MQFLFSSVKIILVDLYPAVCSGLSALTLSLSLFGNPVAKKTTWQLGNAAQIKLKVVCGCLSNHFGFRLL